MKPSEATAAVRVVVADDHTIVRQGLVALLASEPRLSVVGQADSGATAIEVTTRLQPDVVVLDLSLPDLPGDAVIGRLVQEAPQTRVLVLSMHASEEYVRPALQAGARGYLIKGSGLQDLVSAILAVAQGQAFFSAAVAPWLLPVRRGAAQPQSDEERLRSLTPREREVLQAVASGATSAEVGRQLSISTKTVETHRANLMDKLDMHDIPALVRFAVRVGLVPLGR
jgi:two-component system response regulator NreC